MSCTYICVFATSITCWKIKSKPTKVSSMSLFYILHKFHCIILHLAQRVESLPYSKHFWIPTLLKWCDKFLQSSLEIKNLEAFRPHRDSFYSNLCYVWCRKKLHTTGFFHSRHFHLSEQESTGGAYCINNGPILFIYPRKSNGSTHAQYQSPQTECNAAIIHAVYTWAFPARQNVQCGKGL